ncbi:MAG: nucleotidyltransferase domain-containing protein [Leptolyngbya sp. SIO4C1]|nr:nucleotidyltransferase domain-containing protein [Leptolyngbya sp. SIO4C1]
MDATALTPWFTTAVQRLRERLDPEQIILFGSWARGTATRRSDIDLFILCETDQPPLARIGQVLALLKDSPYPVEAIVYTAEELEQRRNLPFMRRILQEGKILYERRKPIIVIQIVI